MSRQNSVIDQQITDTITNLKLDDLSNVDVTGLQIGDLISYNGTNWVPQTPTPSGSSGKLVWTYANGYGVPASGQFQLSIDNNFSGTTQIRISETDKDGNDQSSAISYMGNTKNLLYLRTESAVDNAQTYTIGNNTDIGTYYQMDVVHVGSRSYGANNATTTDPEWKFQPYEA